MERRVCDKDSSKPCKASDGFGHIYDFVSTRENVDKANMRGVEVTANWIISPEWNLAANYTFTEYGTKEWRFQR